MRGADGQLDAAAVERWTAFATDPAAGNPAGVLVLDRFPDAAELQDVAAAVGYSETAFLVQAADASASWDVRYVAPGGEVPFCGHATIATGVALAARGAVPLDDGRGALTLRTRTVGPVGVGVARDGDGAVRATLTSPPSRTAPLPDADRAALLRCFGWRDADLDPAVPTGVAHAGADHPVLPLRDRGTLAAMTYDFDALRDLCHERGWTTVQVVHREAAATWHARDPFPVGGVVEDPATGAAAAALGAHLRAHGLLPADGRLVVHQGVDLGRPSLLHVDATGAAGDPVRVTGTAARIPTPG